jgi:hypothetical protein
MTETNEPAASNVDPHARWKFMRDVVVFESKLALNNLHNFFQIPVTLAVAVFDLVFKGKEEGERFYKLLEWGRTIDDSIDIYSVIEHRQAGGRQGVRRHARKDRAARRKGHRRDQVGRRQAAREIAKPGSASAAIGPSAAE